MRVGLQNYEPNVGHEFIARMQQLYGDENVIHITANVDDLAERAGGTAMHLHGFLTEVVEPYSTNDQNYRVRDIGYTEHTPTDGVISKPNVVMFGETFWFKDGVRKHIYDDLYSVLDSLTFQDTVIVIGSSDTVIPWSIYAGLATNALVVNVNPEKHEKDDYFSYNLYQPVSEAIEVLELYVEQRMNVSDLTEY
jgi:NAD-dependent deacetylase